jgi:hypothetical protein
MGDEVESDQTCDGHRGIGATFRGVIKGLGMRGVWVGILTKYEPDRECAFSPKRNSSILLIS